MRSGALLFLIVASCAKHAPSAPEISPEDVTANYFKALGSGDCTGITANASGSLANEIADAGCAASIDEAKSHGLVFVAADNVRLDGRDPNARLIDVRLEADGKEKKIIARLEHVGGAWKVVTL